MEHIKAHVGKCRDCNRRVDVAVFFAVLAGFVAGMAFMGVILLW